METYKRWGERDFLPRDFNGCSKEMVWDYQQKKIEKLFACLNLIAHNGYEDGECKIDIIPEQEAQNCVTEFLEKYR